MAMPVTKPTTGPKCHFCKQPLVPLPTEKGLHCPTCDSAGHTHIYKRGQDIVGRP